MEDIGRMFAAVLAVFKYEFTLYGFTFSFWEVFAFTMVSAIVVWVIRSIVLGD